MNTIKTGFLMMLMGALLLLVGTLLGGMTGLIIALGFAVALNFFSYWFSDKLALRMTGAHEVSPEDAPDLHMIVDDQVMRAQIPKPKVYIIQNDSPNAFATGRSPKKASIAATTGIIQLLTREELGGVIAHELAHVGNRDTLIMTMVATRGLRHRHDCLHGPIRPHLRRIWRSRPGRRRLWISNRHRRPAANCHSCPSPRHSRPARSLPDQGIPGRRHPAQRPPEIPWPSPTGSRNWKPGPSASPWRPTKPSLTSISWNHCMASP